MRTFKIDNTEVKIHTNWNLTNSINSISTMNCVVIDLLTLLEINEGMEVSFLDSSDKANVILANFKTKLNKRFITSDNKVFKTRYVPTTNHVNFIEADNKRFLTSNGSVFRTKTIANTTIYRNFIEADDKNFITSDGKTFKTIEGTTVLFSGIIQKVFDYEESPGVIFYQLNCADNSVFSKRRLVAESGENEEVSEIIRNKILPYMADDGITEGNLVAGQVLTKYTFNYKYPNVCLDQLKTITGYNWEIDEYKRLNWYPRSNNPAPFILSDDVRINKLKRERSLTKYRNRQFVRAGKGTTHIQTQKKPTPAPDGVSRAFFLDYELSNKPRIYINSTEIDQDDIGIRGADENKKYYYKIGENYITQDESETILTNLDLVEITYIGFYDILIESENEQQINERALIEGTSGVYENIEDEKTLTDMDETLDYANGLLDKYAEVCDKITFETYDYGLKAGQFLDVQRTDRGINSKFLIESINITRHSQEIIKYNVKAIDGVALGGWEEFFKRILQKQESNIINENERLIKLKKIGDETVNIGELVTITESAPVTQIGIAQIGLSEVG